MAFFASRFLGRLLREEQVLDSWSILLADAQDERIFDRVVLIDPTDANFTVTFNPLEKLPNTSIAELASELVSAFKKIWSDSWGVRMEDLMRNSLIALGEAGLTLAGLTHFLTSRNFRKGLIGKVSHPIVKEYFEMLSFPKSSFNLRDVMDHGKILLIKLDKGKLKDSADLLGSLLMAKLQMAAFSRTDIPQSKRTPFYLYIDEFQNFASESLEIEHPWEILEIEEDEYQDFLKSLP